MRKETELYIQDSLDILKSYINCIDTMKDKHLNDATNYEDITNQLKEVNKKWGNSFKSVLLINMIPKDYIKAVKQLSLDKIIKLYCDEDFNAEPHKKYEKSVNSRFSEYIHLIEICESFKFSNYIVSEDQIIVNGPTIDAVFNISWLEKFVETILTSKNLSMNAHVTDKFLIKTKEKTMKTALNEEDLVNLIRRFVRFDVNILKKDSMHLEGIKELLTVALENKKKVGDFKDFFGKFKSNYKGIVDISVKSFDTEVLKYIKGSGKMIYHLELFEERKAHVKLDFSDDQLEILENLHDGFYDPDKKNIIAYKALLKLIDLVDKNKLSAKTIVSSQVLFYLPLLKELLFKSRVKMALNYLPSKNKEAIIPDEFIDLGIVDYTEYIKVRREEIIDLMEALIKEEIKVDELKMIKAKINKLTTEIHEHQKKEFLGEKHLSDQIMDSILKENIKLMPFNDFTKIKVYDNKDGAAFDFVISFEDMMDLTEEMKNRYLACNNVKRKN